MSTVKVRIIPGYYYDENKKKYFKITKDFPAPAYRNTISKEKKKIKRHCDCNCITSHLLLRSWGLQKNKSKSIYERNILSKMSSSRTYKINTDGFPELNDTTHLDVKSVKMSPSGKKMVIESDGERLFQCAIKDNRNENGFDIQITKDITGNNYGISRECLFPERKVISAYDIQDESIAYSTVKEILLRPGYVSNHSTVVQHLNVQDEIRVYSKTFNNIYVTCLATCTQNHQRIMLGDSKQRVRLFDGQRILSAWSVESTPTVLQYFKQSSTSNLLVGCQRGQIELIDERFTQLCVSRYDTTSKGEKRYNIDCIRILDDENYFMSSNWNGNIYLHDMRVTTRGVQQYSGHTNNHSGLSFHLNASQQYIYAVGSDDVLRSWCVSTGELIASVAISNEDGSFIPPLVYSNIWSGNKDVSGLACFTNDSYAFCNLPS